MNYRVANNKNLNIITKTMMDMQELNNHINGMGRDSQLSHDPALDEQLDRSFANLAEEDVN